MKSLVSYFVFDMVIKCQMYNTWEAVESTLGCGDPDMLRFDNRVYAVRREWEGMA